MVASEAPKAMRMGRLKAEKVTVSTAAVHSSMVRELPRIRSAPSRSPAPRRMEARGAPPAPKKAAKADLPTKRAKEKKPNRKPTECTTTARHQ